LNSFPVDSYIDRATIIIAVNLVYFFIIKANHAKQFEKSEEENFSRQRFTGEIEIEI
jgi:hypothetical protein